MDQSLENAVRFISDVLHDNPLADRLTLIEEASERFDLTPLQEESLMAIYIYNAPHPEKKEGGSVDGGHSGD